MTNATVNGGSFLEFVLQWLGVTGASEPPVSCGRRLSCWLTLSILVRKGMVSYAAGKNMDERGFVDEVQRQSRYRLRAGRDN